jgi:selenocysteine lyase/cysteine desulfurase
LIGLDQNFNGSAGNYAASVLSLDVTMTVRGLFGEKSGRWVDFHQAIGAERIQARLHYLKQYWARQVEDEKRIRFTASFDPRLSCAALGFDISGEKWVDIFKALRENANIRISGAWIDGEHGKPETWREIVLVSPAIFTRLLNWTNTLQNSRESSMGRRW